jgi:bacterioferritin-associated ferredoxin
MRRKIKWWLGVYICICNALTDRRLKQAMDEGAGETPGAVYAACGCRAQCGKCAVAIVRMLREHAPAAEPGLALQGAD